MAPEPARNQSSLDYRLDPGTAWLCSVQEVYMNCGATPHKFSPAHLLLAPQPLLQWHRCRASRSSKGVGGSGALAPAGSSGYRTDELASDPRFNMGRNVNGTLKSCFTHSGMSCRLNFRGPAATPRDDHFPVRGERLGLRLDNDGTY